MFVLPVYTNSLAWIFVLLLGSIWCCYCYWLIQRSSFLPPWLCSISNKLVWFWFKGERWDWFYLCMHMIYWNELWCDLWFMKWDLFCSEGVYIKSQGAWRERERDKESLGLGFDMRMDFGAEKLWKHGEKRLATARCCVSLYGSLLVTIFPWTRFSYTHSLYISLNLFLNYHTCLSVILASWIIIFWLIYFVQASILYTLNSHTYVCVQVYLYSTVLL